jgi:hypothetical protein
MSAGAIAKDLQRRIFAVMKREVLIGIKVRWDSLSFSFVRGCSVTGKGTL